MNTVPTIENAPRDLVGLTELGAFMQRRLAESLYSEGFPLWSDEKGKTAFVTSGPEQRGTELEKAIKAFDEKNGKKASSPKAETKAETKSEEKPAEEKKGRRSPQTVAAQQAKAETNGTSQHTATPSDSAQAILLAIKGIEEKVDAIGADVARLGERGAENATAIADLKTTLVELGQLNIAQLGVLSQFGEQVLNAPKEAFLSEASEYGHAAIKVLEASEGKG